MSVRFWLVFVGCSLALLLAGAGCRTMPRLQPADLKEPGWTVHEGQAVWRQKRDAPGIAGELLLATRADGRTLLQFTKNPFPLIIAQCTRDGWQCEVPTNNKWYSGRGDPPQRVFFLYLARALKGVPLPKGWVWEKKEDGGWRLENGKSGEVVEGYLN